MLIPHKDSNYINIVQIHKDSSFMGFCKREDSLKNIKIDVCINNQIIDTINANQNLEIIENLYDINGYSFKYFLPKIYSNLNYILQFKIHQTNEELINSPIIINEDFLELNFKNTLKKEINNEELKKLFKKDSIGFLAIDKHLKDESFIKYLEELSKRFPKLFFKAFYFNKAEEKSIKELLHNKITNLETLFLSDIEKLFNNIEFYVQSNLLNRYNFVDIIRSKTSNIYAFYFNNNFKDSTLKEADKEFQKTQVQYIINPEKYGFTKEEVKNVNNSTHQLIFHHFMHQIGETNFILDLNTNRYEFVHFLTVSYILNKPKFKTQYLEFLKSQYTS